MQSEVGDQHPFMMFHIFPVKLDLRGLLADFSAPGAHDGRHYLVVGKGISYMQTAS